MGYEELIECYHLHELIELINRLIGVEYLVIDGWCGRTNGFSLKIKQKTHIK